MRCTLIVRLLDGCVYRIERYEQKQRIIVTLTVLDWLMAALLMSSVVCPSSRRETPSLPIQSTRKHVIEIADATVEMAVK